MTKNEVFFNFSYSALTLLGNQMYTSRWSAISELVANSLDAGATQIKIYINSQNKKTSTIEIFDNGEGMNYNDLSEKYTLIGRNRREDSNNINKSSKIKGRKGVGKLAGLYLSKKYYIVSKKDHELTSWVLDSNDVKESDIPMLRKVDNELVEIDNNEIWKNYSHGTLIKLTNVDMTNFAEKKLESLKRRIADYYVLDEIGATIEIAYIQKQDKEIKFEEVKKQTAFKNFYGIYESENFLKSHELKKSIPIKLGKHHSLNLNEDELSYINSIERNTVILKPDDFLDKIKTKGEIELIKPDGSKIIKNYELKGWIGIHSTINNEEALKNDFRFIKNDVYNFNKLKLYIRDKLAIDNFLEVLSNNQVYINYIEGEISFDILDDDQLADISSTSREGLAIEDERVQLLIKIVNPIIKRLIKERLNVSKSVNIEAENIKRKKVEAEQKAKEKERKAKEQEIIAREAETEARVSAEKKSKELDEENNDLKNENSSLRNQNNVKDVLLSENDPKRQKLLVHELNTIVSELNYTTEDLKAEFSTPKELDRMFPHLKNLKKNSDKLATIKQQFLKLNNYDVIGKQSIDIKRYIKSYLEKIYLSKTKIMSKFSEQSYMAKIEIFELGVLLDNLITNAAERNANIIEIEFIDAKKELHIVSDTGPISVTPHGSIFELGVTSKKNGTGIGMFLVKEICEDFDWEISVESYEDKVKFILKM